MSRLPTASRSDRRSGRLAGCGGVLGTLSAAAAVAAALAAAGPPGRAAGEGAQATSGPRRWQGTVAVTVHQVIREPGLNECEYDSSYSMSARFVEGDSREYRDRNGAITGTRVELEDAGTTWTGEVKGNCRMLRENPCNCPAGFESGCRNFVLRSTSGGTGRGLFRMQGWLFYGGGTESDPYYHFAAGSSATEVQAGRLTVEGTRCYDTITQDLAFFPIPYIAVGEMPNTPVTSQLNDHESRRVTVGAMAGSYSYTTAHGARGSITVNVRWSLFRAQDWTCVLDEAPEDWRPRHIVMDSSAQPAAIAARLEKPADTDALFRFTLVNVSKEMGFALNSGDGGERDLRFNLGLGTPGQPGFEPPADTADGYEIVTSARSKSATVKVAAWDYGAWGRVKAEVNFDGVWRACRSATMGESVTVPLDRDENRIADAWEARYGVSGQPASTDADAQPAGREAGDGFSNYEEYRGFFTARSRTGTGWSISHGTWVSTDPRMKDVFVHDAIGAGVGDFARTGLTIHLIDEDQYNGNASRLVNFNTGYAGADPVHGQKGLYLRDRALPAGMLGLVEPDIGSPNTVTSVLVDLAQVEYGEELFWVISHELGHAVGLTHPGEYATVNCGGTPRPSVAVRGGVTSGDAGHIMRYHEANYYQAGDGTCYEYPDDDRPGRAYANSLTGTGLNGGAPRTDASGRPLPIAGDASQAGTVVSRLTLKSR